MKQSSSRWHNLPPPPVLQFCFFSLQEIPLPDMKLDGYITLLTTLSCQPCVSILFLFSGSILSHNVSWDSKTFAQLRQPPLTFFQPLKVFVLPFPLPGTLLSHLYLAILSVSSVSPSQRGPSLWPYLLTPCMSLHYCHLPLEAIPLALFKTVNRPKMGVTCAEPHISKLDLT